MNKRNLQPKRALCSVLFVLLLSAGGMMKALAQPTGAINGLFSVSENNQVYFSQGNLQYQASTNTWRFAENQWDFVGEGNFNASSIYEGWIDLYSWGTSGYDHGANLYLPWGDGWAAYGNDDYDLCDGNGQADWGYNAISNGGNQERQWRTCRALEWQYLLESRQTASGIRFAKASVNGINGLIILPDNWNANIFVLNNTNDGNASYDTNVISLDDWSAVLETNGAVFLPAAGRMEPWAENDFGVIGMYWLASHGPAPYLKCLTDFDDSYLYTTRSYYNYSGYKYSVRLVRPAAGTSYSIEAVANPTEGGTISGTGTYDYYSTATLTAIPNEGYSLYQWKEHGNVVSTENTYSVVALFDRNLEACFLETSTYPLLYSFNDSDHTATVIGHWDGTNATGELVIPNNVLHNGETYTVTAINGWAFRYCHGLTEVVIPSSVTSIGVNPFANCSNLAQITVESGNAYYDSRDDSHAIIETATNTLISGSLSTVIPPTVTSLGQDAFHEILVSSIIFPASVNYIGVEAIMAISTLSSITVFEETPPVLDYCAFCDVNKSIPVYVPCSSLDAYQNASGWSEFTNFIPVGQCSGVVTVTANPADYGTVTGGGSFEGGETCTVIATPNEGYYFLCWKENDQWVSSQATYNFPVYRDRDLTAVFTTSAENVVNGDFEQGNIGFTSEYGYNYDFGQGGYYVDYDAHGRYPGLGHGGTGKFMLIDGATEPDVIVWTEQLSVVPNTYYTLSAWVCTLCGPSALLQFSINGTQIGDVFTAPSQTNTWQQFSAIWYSGSSTTATITIIDQNTQAGGNDFGLDDISFRELAYPIEALPNPYEGGMVTGAGSYQQGQTCTLTATANTGYIFINWTEDGEVVSTEANYSFTVSDDRTLVANFNEIVNHWEPESNPYEDNMTLTCIVQIDGVEQATTTLELGAFCGTECRGSQLANYFAPTNRYIFQMTIFGESNDEISFRLYDHQQNQELLLTPPAPITFTTNGYGSLINPYVLNFTSAITHTQALNSGWNWWSTYIELNNNDGLSQLENSIGEAGVMIKSRTNGYVEAYEYNGATGWFGTLDSIRNEQMYKIRTNAACNATVEGLLAVPANHPISIKNGWNWIGFPCNQNVNVDVAMSGFTPENNDILKGRNGFTTYYSDGNYNMWYGTLTTLEPGKGYMYRSNSATPKTLTFQTGRGETTMENVTTEDNIFQPADGDFADNMTITAVLELDGEELHSDDYELAAFVGDECRGSVRLMYVEPVNRFVAFLTVFGEPLETLYFRLTDGTQTELSMDEITFAADGMEGTLSEPMTLRFGTTKLDENEWSKVLVYPNPSNGVFNIQGQDIRKIEVFNAFGQAVVSEETSNNHLQIDLSRYADGCYMLRVVTDNGIINRQLIKK